MAITVLNPFDGEPMKVRDTDAGRAVKDKQGRIFYVLPRSDGQGYYGATTRAGNPKEEQRAMELEVKASAAAGHTQASVQGRPVAKKSAMGKIIVLIIIMLLAAAGAAYFMGMIGGGSATQTVTPSAGAPAMP
jgi:hypothetical protein